MYEYKSGLADLMQTFVEEKRALGCKYEKEAGTITETTRREDRRHRQDHIQMGDRKPDAGCIDPSEA